MSEPKTTNGDLVVAEDVVRCRNLAADNLAAARQAFIAAQNDLSAWELECWKRLPIGYGIRTTGQHWELIKVGRL